jgi:hypothetical protein
MEDDDETPKKYAQAMAKFGNLGHAIFYPTSTRAMRLGHCGYFDRYRTWNPIGVITEPPTLPEGITLFDNSKLQNPFVDENFSWGEKISSNVSQHKLDIDISAA